MLIKIPKLSLVVLIGPSGSGKTTFARRHFLPTEILSSDICRAMVADDENDQSVTPHAFEILHHIAAKRLELGKLTVIDATNVQPESRKPLARAGPANIHCLPVAIVFDLPEQDLPRAKSRSSRPKLRPPRRAQPEVAIEAVVALASERRASVMSSPSSDPRMPRRRPSSERLSGTIAATTTVRST